MPRGIARAVWVLVGLFFLTFEIGRAEESVEQLKEVIRKLEANLAIARDESELFQKKWSEARLRAQMLGVNPADDAATQAQRQLVESVRALYLAEAERQRLIEELKRVLLAVESNKDVAAELQRAKELLAASDRPLPSERGNEPKSTSALGGAQIVDVNAKLRLVVLDVGLAQGVRVGMPFVVLRGGKIVAELKVVEVRRRICGALIEKAEQGVTLVVGDTARVTKS